VAAAGKTPHANVLHGSAAPKAAAVEIAYGKEGTFAMDGIEAFGFSLAQLAHLGGDDLETVRFKAGIDLADDVLGDGVHRDRPFFADLVKFMTSGPVMIQVLEGENAILKNRELMGATDPKKAAAGTIRADFAESIDANAVHGSDAPETAAVEIAYFFPTLAIHSR